MPEVFDLFSSSVVQRDERAEVAQYLRRFQMKHGSRISPEASVRINNMWSRLADAPHEQRLDFVDRLFDIYDRRA